MKITVTVSDKQLKEVINDRLENALYDEFDAGVLKKAKIPAKTAVLKSIMENEAFKTAVEKELSEVLTAAADDCLTDVIWDIDIPVLEASAESCWKICEEQEEEEAKKSIEEAQKRQVEAEAKQIERTIAALSKLGYKVVKA